MLVCKICGDSIGRPSATAGLQVECLCAECANELYDGTIAEPAYRTPPRYIRRGREPGANAHAGCQVINERVLDKRLDVVCF